MVSSWTYIRLLLLRLHERPNPEPQGVDLDEAGGVGLGEDLILFKSGEVVVEEGIGLRLATYGAAVKRGDRFIYCSLKPLLS